MTRSAHRWLWVAVGGCGAGALGAAALSRRTSGEDDGLLAYPVDREEPLQLTPAGSYGAARKGPPAHAHQGIDIVARPSSSVITVGDGEIVATKPGLGKTVLKLRLDEPGQWLHGTDAIDFAVYADLGEALVKPGNRVRGGQIIAKVAAAGFVHFAVKQRRADGETFIDPRRAGLRYSLAGRAVRA